MGALYGGLEGQEDGGHAAEHPMNEILAIRRYRVVYTIFRAGT